METRFRIHSSPIQIFSYWDSPGKNTGRGLPCPPQGDLPDPGIEPASLTSPALAGGFFTTKPLGKPTAFILLLIALRETFLI